MLDGAQCPVPAALSKFLATENQSIQDFERRELLRSE
jgi:hypothetical protein